MVATVDMDFTRLNALAVGDDTGGIATIGIMMHYMGLKSYLNTTGRGVVELARAMKPPPDIIFLDLNLPRVSGFDILRQIRADERLHKTLVVAVTAYGSRADLARCMAVGFDGFITKPISRTRFPRQLRLLLSGEPVWEMN
jgi:two-component system cell cycle response regulator DivK